MTTVIYTRSELEASLIMQRATRRSLTTEDARIREDADYIIVLAERIKAERLTAGMHE